MKELSVNWYIFISFCALLAWVLYYISNRKKRKSIYYHKSQIGWEKQIPAGIGQKDFRIFLIGDAGAPSLTRQEPNLKLLQSQLLQAGKNSAIFFLGDNIYPYGLSKPESPMRDVAEKHLLGQLNILEGYKGKAYFISGNHDWNKGRVGGYEAVVRQQKYLEDYFKREDILLPRNGCPGPVEINLSSGITAVIINTQWWVQRGKTPIGAKDGCTCDNDLEFFIHLEEILEKNKDKKLIVIGHHPMYSKAFHGGRFDMKQHLFPLTELNKKMYVPLPLVGSIYPIYRKYIGIREDMAHPRYKRMRKNLLKIFKKYDNLVYAAGHDHNLQYIRKANQHYIVSGSGCKVTSVQRGRGAFFTHAHRGFFLLDYYPDNQVWLEAWEPTGDGTPGVLAYRKELHDKSADS